jgi:hypothetical protein
VSSDAAVAVAKSLVHIHLVVPSLTALNALLRGEWERRLGTLTEADEIEAMRAFKVADRLGPEVLVLPRVEGLEGWPRVLVSLRAFPDADRAFALEHLRHLKALGSRPERRDALELPVSEALISLLVRYGFRVDRPSKRFHGDCNDITVIGPGGRLYNIELRNRRTEVHDGLKAVDREAITRGAGRGITTVFVVPRCTRRFKRKVEELGGVVIETGVYVTGTEEGRDALAGFSWMNLAVELGTKAAPRIAEQIASVIRSREDRMILAPHDVVDPGVYVTPPEEQRIDLADFNWTLPVESEAEAAPRIAEQIRPVILTPEIPIVRAPIDLNPGASETSGPVSEEDKAEIDRYVAPRIQRRQEAARIRIQQRQEADKISRSVLRVMGAIELYRSGVPTMAEAASRIGISELWDLRDLGISEPGISKRHLGRAFDAVGEPRPWSHGGPRPGAGRKSRGHRTRGLPTPPPPKEGG